jgi:hypothetical protein
MKIRYEWTEIQNAIRQNMNTLVKKIQDAEDKGLGENVLTALNKYLAQANSAYKDNQEMIKAGEPCPYVRYENEG